MNQERIYTIIKAPVVSEKSTNLAQDSQTYVFKVIKDATKQEVKKAVELIFQVNVLSVTTVNCKGKVKRTRGRMGKHADSKKAYVRLAEGQTIDLASN